MNRELRDLEKTIRKKTKELEDLESGVRKKKEEIARLEEKKSKFL